MKGSPGLTLLEIAVVLVVTGILLLAGASAAGKYAKRGTSRYEADQIAGVLWELRSKATLGMRNPCLDFPDSATVRLYRDLATLADGFGAGDEILREYRMKGGVRILAISGGRGATHSVCFESRGIPGSAATGLEVTLGSDESTTRKVRLLPSTGIAKVL